ncbi:Initiation-specific alpha-16-mannosyltransferase [Pyrenophora seminiperda CCB06]|uniref:Initiation-specific alpha-16-mannosyltransferase n=1 Tax=Pyrenophora seminiperda CCB06 TaxID=1302712 RepID=A0A3M7M637_9PLEO|nr:Initiation-specific alpha-16-mannosyltransferase [Pyrenophora seminiperda CCB06]
MPCQNYPMCHAFSWQPASLRRSGYWACLALFAITLVHFWNMGDIRYLRIVQQPPLPHLPLTSNSTPSTSNEIPKLIWYKLGPMGLTRDTKKWTDTCIKGNPEYRASFLTDETADEYVKDTYAARPDIVQYYLGLSIPILKADMLRYLLLFDQGGIYSDLDVSCKGVPMDEWVPEQYKANASVVVGWEFDMGFEEPIMMEFESWTIMAKPHSRHMLQVIDDMIDAIEDTMEKYNVSVGKITLDMIGDVVDFSGPRRLTNGILTSVQRQLNRRIEEEEIRKIYQPKLVADVLIMPAWSFAASQNRYQPGDELKMPPKLVQHHYAGTWKNKHGGETLPQVTARPAAR